MDLPLLRMLQSMKRIEDDPACHFQTKTLDLATFVPKYPNVILVDQSVDSSRFPKSFPFVMTPLPVGGVMKCVFVTNTLSRALSLPINLGNGDTQALNVPQPEMLKAAMKGFTVVLKEGLYINPFTMVTEKDILCQGLVLGHLPEYPGFEIVGLKDVRLLFTEASGSGAIVAAGRIILSNLRVYDFRTPSYGLSAVKIKALKANADVKVDLIDVKIHSPGIDGLFIDKSVVSFRGCAITGCKEGLRSDGAQISMASSTVTYNYVRGVVLHYGTKCSITKSRFVGPNMVFVQGKCDVSISGSQNFMITCVALTY